MSAKVIMSSLAMRSLFLATSTLSSMALALPAFAQQRAAGIEELVVTAQRRQENILEVPMSIQAISGTQLTASGITTLTDLPAATPGVFALSFSGFTQMFIRGVGSNVTSGADPSVAYYVDDVPRIYATTNDKLIDVQRVEVLKGAQGGLYGRNATGGVVNVITRQPSTEKFEGNILIDYGEKNTFRAAGYVNVPVNDRVAFSLAAERDSHDPYIKNIATTNPYTAAMFPTGSRFGTAQQTADRFNAGVQPKGLENGDYWQTDDKILLKLSDNLKVTLAGDYTDSADTNGNAQAQQIPAATQAYLGGLLRVFGFNAVLPAGFEKTPGKFQVSIGDNNLAAVREYGMSGTVVWNLPSFDLTSITAYRHQHSTYYAGANAGTLPDVTSNVLRRRHFVYQELRAASTSSGPLHLQGGATYLNSHILGTTASWFFGGVVQNPLTKAGYTVKNWSIYAQAAYDFTQNISLTVSGRYVHEQNHSFFVLPTPATIDSVEKKFLPSVTLSYKLDEGTVYARWARGFKAGGINPSVNPSYFPNPRTDGDIFGPETVDTYEVGYRQRVFDDKAQLSTAVFYNDYRDLQATVRAQPAFASTIIQALVNAGSARTWGVEQSVDWRVADPITLGASVAYLNAKYKTFQILNNPVLANVSLSGHQMADAPKLQLAFTADVDQPINDKFRLVGRLLVSHTSRVFYAQSSSPATIPDVYSPGYWLTNVRVGLRTSDDKYGLSFFANNLFNKAYFVSGNTGAGGNQLKWGTPRVMGAEVTAKF